MITADVGQIPPSASSRRGRSCRCSARTVALGLSGFEGPLLVRLHNEPRYHQLFAAAFPGDANPFTLANLTRALASFERTLLSGHSPYDHYRTGANSRAISDSAKRGESLFFSERTE